MLTRTFANYQRLKTNKDGDVFIDRDGKAFLTMINYLRNDRLKIPVFDSKAEFSLYI